MRSFFIFPFEILKLDSVVLPTVFFVVSGLCKEANKS